MPNLEEYKAKLIFNNFGIAIPKGSAVSAFSEFDEDIIAWPEDVVLKSQIPVGSRGKKGGVVFAKKESFKDILEDLLNKRIDNMIPEKVLVEEKIDYSNEAYISIYSCPSNRAPVLSYSVSGGMNVENMAKDVITTVVDEQYNVHKLRTFFKQINVLSDQEARDLAVIAEKLYSIYKRFDCKLVEINPLVRASSEYIALDAKMMIDEDAVFRQKELGLDFFEEVGGREPTELEMKAAKIDENDHRGTAHFVELSVDEIYKQYGDQVKCLIGFNCVGTGSSLTVMDELAALGYFPKNFADTSGNPPASKVYEMTKIVLTQKNIRGYVFATCVSSQQLDNTARGLIKAFKEVYSETKGVPPIPCVILLRGAWESEAINLFKENELYNVKNIFVLEPESTERILAAKFDKIYRNWVGENNVDIY